MRNVDDIIEIAMMFSRGRYHIDDSETMHDIEQVLRDTAILYDNERVVCVDIIDDNYVVTTTMRHLYSI